MHVKILKPCGVNGKSVNKGEVISVSQEEGRLLCAMGKAQPSQAPKQKKEGKHRANE